jgi:hypothetical protein
MARMASGRVSDASCLLGVRAGTEVRASPQLDFLLHQKYEAVNKGDTEKEARPASHRPRSTRHVQNAPNSYRSG